jgi:4-amino-4-deoxychorismate lyase
MRVQHRTTRLLNYHLERLSEGCRRLAIRAPNRERLQNELTRIAARKSDAVMKLIVSRGVGPRGYRPSGHERASRMITLHPLQRAVLRANQVPVEVRLCSTRLGINEALAGLKSLNRLESVLARAEWADTRVWEGLMQDTDDNIVCGTMSNVFSRRGSTLMTPLLDRCGVAGVMRRWVLGQARAANLRPVEARLRWKDLERADEVFMTNAVVGIVPVAMIRHGRSRVQFANHPAAAALRSRLES